MRLTPLALACLLSFNCKLSHLSLSLSLSLSLLLCPSNGESSRGDRWQHTIETCCQEYSANESRNFLNGSLHWLTWKELSRDAEAQIRLVAFSLAEERFVEVPLPDADDGCVIRVMCVFDGCLCVSGVDAVQSGLGIWVMKEYMVKSSWTKLCTILWDTIPGCRAFCLPLCSLQDGTVLLEIDQICVVKYNMNEKNYSTVTKLESKSSLKALTYVESLISPNFDDVQQQHQLF